MAADGRLRAGDGGAEEAHVADRRWVAIAAYLPHLHEEETVVMARIWDARTDEEIAATRAAFMATMTPQESMQAITLMLPAVDPATRAALVTRIAASAPAPVLTAVLEAADSVLAAEEAASLRLLAARPG